MLGRPPLRFNVSGQTIDPASLASPSCLPDPGILAAALALLTSLQPPVQVQRRAARQRRSIATISDQSARLVAAEVLMMGRSQPSGADADAMHDATGPLAALHCA